MPSGFPPRKPLSGPGFNRPGRPGTTLPNADTAPHPYAVSPNADRVAGGTTVTIKGSNFVTSSLGAVPVVNFGATPGTGVVVVDSQTLTVVVPAGADGLVDLQVVNPNGQDGTIPDSFTYIATKVTGIEPNHGPIAGGTTVLISGANFVAVPVVTVGGVAVAVMRIDSQRLAVVTPSHAQGQVIISVDGVDARDRFFYTLLTRGQDFRKNPSVTIDETVDAPCKMTFSVDGTSAPPKVGEEISYTDDSATVLFAGVVQLVQMGYEEIPNQLVWNVTASDYTPWLNRRRPSGQWIYASATDVIIQIMNQVAPWATTAHVQTGLPLISLTLDGTDDTATVLTKIARLIGNGYWRFDYTKDLHFILTDAVVTYVEPTAPTIPGGGEVNPTAITLAESSTLGTMLPGYVGVFCSFVYSNGAESALGPMSDLILFRGTKLPVLTNIPLGAIISGIPCTERRIYYKWFGINGSVTLSGFTIISDNVTTTVTTGPRAVKFAAPRLPSAHPPAVFQHAPAASEHVGVSARDAMGAIYPELYGASGARKAFTFTAATYAFKLSANFEDGTESQLSDATEPVDLTGNYAVRFSTNNHGDDVGTASVLYWKVYASKSSTRGVAPNWTPATTTLWAVIPGNTNGTYDIVPSVKDVELSLINSTTLSSSTDNSTTAPPPPNPTLGPNPDLANNPPDILDGGVMLLKDPPIQLTVDGTQVRNRIIVYGPPKVDPPPIQIPPPPVVTTTTVTAGINVYLGSVVGPGTMGLQTVPGVDTPVIYLNSHPYLGQWKGYPVNARWMQFFNYNHPGIIAYNGIKVSYDPDWMVHNGLTKEFIMAHPFTVFMELPDDYYEPGGGAGVPNTTAVDTSQSQATADIFAANENAVSIVRRNRYQFDDVDSQRYMGSIELNADGTRSDGVHEVVIDPLLPSDAECMAFAQAQLSQFAWPISTVTYSTRSPTHPGQKVHINLTDPPIKGDFLITHVTVDQIKDESDSTILLPPRYNVTASDPVKFDFDDLLLSLTGGGDGALSVDSLASIGIAGGNNAMAAINMLMQRAASMAASQIPTSAFLSQVIDVSDTQLISMSNVTALDLIPAAGAGTILIPVWIQTEKNSSAASSSIGSAGALNFFWGGSGTGSWSGFNFANINADLTVGNRSSLSGAVATIPSATGYGTRDPRNRPISMISASAISAGAGATGSLTVRIEIFYYKITSVSTT